MLGSRNNGWNNLRDVYKKQCLWLRKIQFWSAIQNRLSSEELRWIFNVCYSISTFRINEKSGIMILEFVRNHLRLLGLLHLPNDEDKRVKFAYIWNYLVFISLGIFTIPTFCYFLFEATTFSDYVNSFFFTTCGILGFSFKANLLHEKSKLNQLIIRFDEICNERRNYLNFSLQKLYFLGF